MQCIQSGKKENRVYEVTATGRQPSADGFVGLSFPSCSRVVCFFKHGIISLILVYSGHVTL